ncbi:hypothetical protein R9C00_11405 [Flammeovirgaceae bacterium SG7u.111]|nr:hypothetical protein [Flammeovirgaceae bacterium SG7u.132]WPO38058.1 hypothetical protein R9C00_11405 [Flammeovirgaceae bacterium SG7u.111]
MTSCAEEVIEPSFTPDDISVVKADGDGSDKTDSSDTGQSREGQSETNGNSSGSSGEGQ